MDEHPNATLMRTGYAAFAAGDSAALDALFADDVVWEVSGRSPMAGTYKGKGEVFGGFFAGIAERSGGTFTVEIETVLADDTHAVCLVHQRGQREGRTLDARAIDVYQVRDGRVVAARSVAFDPYGTDAFWS